MVGRADFSIILSRVFKVGLFEKFRFKEDL